MESVDAAAAAASGERVQLERPESRGISAKKSWHRDVNDKSGDGSKVYRPGGKSAGNLPRPQRKRNSSSRKLRKFKPRHRAHCREKQHNTAKKKKRRAKMIPCPVLRPFGSQVPRAPENSTQFIMDNHENSNLFINFDSNDVTSSTDGDRLNSFYSEAYAQDEFETLYRSSHEESLMNSTVSELKTAIINLESRCATLDHNIASRPSVLLGSLQSLLIELQEENKRLRQEYQQLCNPAQNGQSSVSSSSSITSSSGSSSDSDSSASSSSHSRQNSAQES